MATVLLSAATFWFEGWGGAVGAGRKKLRRTRQLSDQSSDKEGHSHLRALPKMTPRI